MHNIHDLPTPLRASNTIVLRPLSFLDRDCHFLIEARPASATAPQPAPASATQPAAVAVSQSAPIFFFPSTLASCATETALEFVCWRVPVHLRSVQWRELLSSRVSELVERLVLPSSSCPTLKLLSKMEAEAFIHCYTVSNSRNNTIVWELPRFGLELEQRGGEVLSRDYTGYRLARYQQLAGTVRRTAASGVSSRDRDDGAGGDSRDGGGDVEGSGDKPMEDSGGSEEIGDRSNEDNGDSPRCCWYTLPEFQQYLVLERADSQGSHDSSCTRLPDLLVLVPAGEVRSEPLAGNGGGGLVTVEVPEESDARIKVTGGYHSTFPSSCRFP